MIRNLKINKILWFLTGLLSLSAAFIGVCYSGIYGKVISGEMLPGVISQDLVAILLSVFIFFCLLRLKEEDVIKQVIILGTHCKHRGCGFILGYPILFLILAVINFGNLKIFSETK